MDVVICPECKVPEPFNQGQEWLNNGDIIQRVNPEARAGFIECENLDPLFKNIGDIIGVSIESMVVNITARGIETYMSKLVPPEVKKLVEAKQMNPEVFTDPIMTYCHIMGYGKYESVDSRYERDEDDYSIFRILEPFSVPEAAGSLVGAVSAVVGGEHAVTYKEVSPGLYEFITTWTEYPEVLVERLKPTPYRHRDGDIDLERCATCGAPAALSEFKWFLDKGLIVSRHTGRRMALLGTELLDVVFKALEAELGETIPNVVVEAQRRFVKGGFYSINEISDEGDFRTQLAVRGMGNLREISMDSRGMHLRIDSAAGYLMTVGMVQGLFEMALDVDSHVNWELTDSGDLELEVIPRGTRETVDI
ncbi:MAG: hypothetical protein JW854_04580 [Actinobacteria bacterium]|nr:hypothetical protein [Actinomycetota bacterium]